MAIQKIITKLNLLPHPEGGFYKETYRSKGEFSVGSLNEKFSGNRSYCTGIYFLLTKNNFSAFHKIKQDEMWHFYDGDALTVHMIDKDGVYHKQLIGNKFHENQVPQFVVPRGAWFASSVEEDGEYSLVGCTVSPGFDFDDFELADRASLINEHPIHKKIITKLTRI
jgi:predicted cupin superfamily sugar epimerase